MKCPVDIENLYNAYITAKNKENYKTRYKDREKYYHASGGGSCSRKQYFESIEQIETTNPTNEASNRILRLGTIVHEDLQSALSDTIYSNTIDSNTIHSKEKEIHYLQKEKFDFHIEKEIVLPEFNVRGFYDLVAVSQYDGSVYLIDFKTMANFSWSRKFGWKNVDPNPSIHQEIQLATYGLFVQKEFKRIDGMFLYFYNKDNSKMRSVEVPLTMLKRAENFWINVNEEHKKGLPSFKQGVSPVQDWNCRYCRFLDHCKPPFFKKK